MKIYLHAQVIHIMTDRNSQHNTTKMKYQLTITGLLICTRRKKNRTHTKEPKRFIYHFVVNEWIRNTIHIPFVFELYVSCFIRNALFRKTQHLAQGSKVVTDLIVRPFQQYPLVFFQQRGNTEFRFAHRVFADSRDHKNHPSGGWRLAEGGEGRRIRGIRCILLHLWYFELDLWEISKNITIEMSAANLWIKMKKKNLK